jgi:predicted NACHT family NTPase
MSSTPRCQYNWKRFWCPRSGTLDLSDGGYLVDPDEGYGRFLHSDLRTFEDISDLPCLALLGQPGIGKTTAMRTEWKAVEARAEDVGDETIWVNLGAYGSEERLVHRLFDSKEFATWKAGDHRLHLFLDSLDECRLLISHVAAFLVEELAEQASEVIDRLSIRVGCRTAEWPTILETGMTRLWGEEAVGVYELAPLRRIDVLTAAEASGLNADAFLSAVVLAEAVPLAIKPVTLEFLLESYGDTGGFPSRQVDLYLDGCRRLCEERNLDRVKGQQTGELGVEQRLVVAARVAALTIFSGKEAVWTGLERAVRAEDDVLVRELAYGVESVGEQVFPVGEAAIKEVLKTGLFSARGPDRLGWAHQTYAEFLAAYYLARRNVETDQAMSLVLHPDDEEGRLVPQLHETAAWLASMSDGFFRVVMDTEPEVLLRSDVASTDVEAKNNLVVRMLKMYDEGKLLDVGLVPHNQYK